MLYVHYLCIIANNEQNVCMKNIEKNIVTKAVAGFEEQTGLKLTVYVMENIFDVILRDKEYELKFNTEIVPLVNIEKLGFIRNRLVPKKNIPLLITTFVNTNTADKLRGMGINYIDTVGNVYINIPPLFIHIKGNRLDKKRKNINISQAEFTFGAAGLQIVFALLCNPELVKNTYREIALITDVALGTVAKTFKYLEELGFLTVDIKGNKKLLNKEKLLRNWVTDYPTKLKPKYFHGRYHIDQPEQLETIDMKYYDALWGGETAAAKLTNYLHPFIHTLYVNEKFGELVLKKRLKKNINGNILLYKKFWNFNDDNTINDLVPNILIYTDLMITGDERNIETANLIYEKEIAQHIR